MERSGGVKRIRRQKQVKKEAQRAKEEAISFSKSAITEFDMENPD
jgi:hypothetical protein